MNRGWRIGGSQWGPAFVVEIDPYERIWPFWIDWAWMPTIRKGWLTIRFKRLIVRVFPR